MKDFGRFLSESDINQIHRTSLRILNEVGVMLPDRKLGDLLRKRGIAVDAQGQVRLPPEVVEQAIRVTPHDFSLYAHSGEELPLEEGNAHPATYPNALRVLDYGAESARPSTRADLEHFVLLGDALSQVHIVSPSCWARDMADDAQALHTVATVLLNTTKHTEASPQNALEAEIWWEMASIADEGLDPDSGPTIHFGVSPLSPFQVAPDTYQVLRYGAEHGIPLKISSCPMAGATSPYTLAGTVAQANAENLFLVTLAQLVQEGTPIILGGASGCIDMRTGGLSYGCPERHVMLGASVELARHYGLPHYSPAGSVDASQPDIQSGLEKMLTWMTRLMSGVTLGIVFGSLSTGSAISLEQMLIDAESFEMARRVLKGLQVNEDTLAFEAMERVGPGGNYLRDEHTMRWLRAGEHWFPNLASRGEADGVSMLERANERVRAILEVHRSPVSEKVADKMCSYVEEKTRELH